ncbi:hypothetical protein [Micromonospora sp. NPDC049679]|uniref:hypothetical protein n=1 Tax=Micromonospora sp. NPDC049679 TaxID=3155920 RepID=UPI0033E89308
MSSGPVSSSGWRQSAPTGRWDRPADTGEWQRTPETDQWQRSDDTGEWTRAGHTGEWRNPHASSWSEPGDSAEWSRDPYPRDWRDDTSAGQWRQGAHTGQFDRITDTGSWSATSDAGAWPRTEPPGRQPRGPVETESSWRDSDDTFWSGTRLAGDDPRWVETPVSAPRSPAVAYPRPPRSRPAPPPVRQVYRPPVRRGRGRGPDEELLDFDPGGHVASLLYTALWYAVPVLFFALWTFTLDNTPPPAGCVTDVTGGGCQSERAQAIASVVGGAPQFGAALLASLVVAIVLRWASGTWRAASVGLAAAVVGGGLSTVVFSALTGQPVG